MSYPKSGNDSVKDPRPRMISAAPVGQSIDGGETLVHPNWIVGAEHRHRRAEVDVLRTRRDCGQHDLRRRDREVWAVMLAHADEVDAELVCQDSLIDDIPYDARLWQNGSIVGDRDIAKGVEAELELLHNRSEPTELAADSAT
jgi:hypothetical protein